MRNLLCSMTLLIAGCFSGSETPPEEPVAPIAESKPGANDTKEPEVAKIAPLPPPKPLPPDPCTAFDAEKGLPPIYLKEKGVVVTRFLKTCVTRGGDRGYLGDTPWIAMGIPCTGEEGKVRITGYSSAPKLVSFPVTTDCRMNPASLQEADKSVREVYTLPNEARLMALNPFVVQYWEIPGLEDADVGFSIDLVTVAARESMWKKMKRNEPMRVKMYGRENAWIQNDQVFMVEADVHLTSNNSGFKLTILEVQSLSPEEADAVKERCYALRPRRNCVGVF